MISRQLHCFGYGRASTDKQKITTKKQREFCEREFERLIEMRRLPEGMIWGGWFVDNATDADTPWFQRAGGAALFSRMGHGDHVICAEKDRIFRSCLDACQTIDQLAKMDIRLHVLDSPVDVSTDQGRCFMQMMASWAELEKRTISRRTAEALQFKKAHGLPHGPGAPVGWKIVGRKSNARFVEDPEGRELAATVTLMHEEHGATFDEITFNFERRGIRRKDHRGKLRPYSRNTLYLMHRAHLAGFPLHNGSFSPGDPSILNT